MISARNEAGAAKRPDTADMKRRLPAK